MSLLVFGPLSCLLLDLLLDKFLLKGELNFVLMQALSLILHDALQCVDAPMECLSPHESSPAEILVGEKLVVRAFATFAKLYLLHIKTALLLVQHERADFLRAPVVNDAFVVIRGKRILEASHKGEPVLIKLLHSADRDPRILVRNVIFQQKPVRNLQEALCESVLHVDLYLLLYGVQVRM